MILTLFDVANVLSRSPYPLGRRKGHALRPHPLNTSHCSTAATLIPVSRNASVGAPAVPMQRGGRSPRQHSVGGAPMSHPSPPSGVRTAGSRGRPVPTIVAQQRRRQPPAAYDVLREPGPVAAPWVPAVSKIARFRTEDACDAEIQR